MRRKLKIKSGEKLWLPAASIISLGLRLERQLQAPFNHARRA